MSGSHSKSIFADLWDRFRSMFIPCRGDSVKLIISKTVLSVSVITFVVSAVYLANYFLSSAKEESIVEDSRTVWHNVDIPVTERFSELTEENPDFKAWLTVGGTSVDNPVYQTDNNEYYLKHNQKKQSARCGALFFDSLDSVGSSEDKTLVIFGHNMKDGSMFGTLKKLRNLKFYKENPTITLSTVKEDSTYVIYSVFLLNAVSAHDNDRIYDINKSTFSSQNEFDLWRDEAFERSIINTDVDVQYGDEILTLVTCAYDFDEARLAVMARKLRDGETIDTANATVNGHPRYPKRWYDERNLEFPW